MMLVYNVCVDVFCDSTDGLLAGRLLSPGDDVCFVTSSVINVHRRHSQYENSSSRDQCDEMIDDDRQQQQQQQQHGHDDDDEKTATSAVSDDKLAAAEWLEMDRQDDRVDFTSHEIRQQQQLQKDDVKHTSRPTPVPRDVKPTASQTAQASPSSSPAAAASQRAERSRPTPPVSRVKPMMRQHQSDTKWPLSGRPDVPVPAQRQRTFSSVDDIPSDLTSLSAADVSKCIVLLGIGQQQADLLHKQGVDGQQLTTLTEDQLTKQFQLTPLDANKLARFSRGWRPT